MSPHYPLPPPPGGKKILISPPVYRSFKSFSQKDISLDTDKLANLMPRYPFWAVPDPASDFVSDKMSHLLNAGLNILPGLGVT